MKKITLLLLLFVAALTAKAQSHYDVNGDGKVSMADANLVTDVFLGLSKDELRKYDDKTLDSLFSVIFTRLDALEKRSSQGDDSQTELVGTWICTSSTDTYDGTAHSGLMVGKEVTLNSDGTFTSTSSDMGKTGTWSMSDNVVTAYSNNRTIVMTVTISGSTMQWQGTTTDGVTFEYLFTKESDADTHVTELVGTWICTASTDTYDGTAHSGLMVGKEVTLNSDGTFTSTSSDMGKTGTWSMSGNVITAYSNNRTIVMTVTISGSTMQWQGTTTDGVTFEYTFQKE